MNLEVLVAKFKQYPVIIIGGVVGVICLVLIYVRGSRAEEFEVLLGEKDRQWSQMQTNVERSKDLLEHAETLNLFVESLDDRLMVSESVAINHEFFYALERKTGVQISTINQLPLLDPKNIPAQIKDVKEFIPISYNITIDGNYNDIIRFVYLLERDHYIIRMDSFNLTKRAEATTADNEVAPPSLTARIECYVLGKKDA